MLNKWQSAEPQRRRDGGERRPPALLGPPDAKPLCTADLQACCQQCSERKLTSAAAEAREGGSLGHSTGGPRQQAGSGGRPATAAGRRCGAGQPGPLAQRPPLRRHLPAHRSPPVPTPGPAGSPGPLRPHPAAPGALRPARSPRCAAQAVRRAVGAAAGGWAAGRRGRRSLAAATHATPRCSLLAGRADSTAAQQAGSQASQPATPGRETSRQQQQQDQQCQTSPASCAACAAAAAPSRCRRSRRWEGRRRAAAGPPRQPGGDAAAANPGPWHSARHSASSHPPRRIPTAPTPGPAGSPGPAPPPPRRPWGPAPRPARQVRCAGGAEGGGGGRGRRGGWGRGAPLADAAPPNKQPSHGRTAASPLDPVPPPRHCHLPGGLPAPWPPRPALSAQRQHLAPPTRCSTKVRFTSKGADV